MTYKRILVPIDGSPTSKRGLREAIGFAKAQKARLQLVHVVDVHNAVLAGLEGGPAVTDLAAFIVTVHADPLTASHPLQPTKTDPAAAVAVSVTVVPLM